MVKLQLNPVQFLFIPRDVPCSSGIMTVVKMDSPAYLCKTDEVGEICVASAGTGSQYWGLPGLSNTSFKVAPLLGDASPLSQDTYTRSGLLGFLGPVSNFKLLGLLGRCYWGLPGSFGPEITWEEKHNNTPRAQRTMPVVRGG